MYNRIDIKKIVKLDKEVINIPKTKNQIDIKRFQEILNNFIKNIEKKYKIIGLRLFRDYLNKKIIVNKKIDIKFNKLQIKPFNFENYTNHSSKKNIEISLRNIEFIKEITNFNISEKNLRISAKKNLIKQNKILINNNFDSKSLKTINNENFFFKVGIIDNNKKLIKKNTINKIKNVNKIKTKLKFELLNASNFNKNLLIIEGFNWLICNTTIGLTTLRLLNNNMVNNTIKNSKEDRLKLIAELNNISALTPLDLFYLLRGFKDLKLIKNKIILIEIIRYLNNINNNKNLIKVWYKDINLKKIKIIGSSDYDNIRISNSINSLKPKIVVNKLSIISEINNLLMLNSVLAAKENFFNKKTKIGAKYLIKNLNKKINE